MKNILFILCIILFAGCAETTRRVDSFVDDPGTILQDPSFANYEQELNALEKQYLQKQITYSDYLEQKKELEENYSREIQKQNGQVDDPLNHRGRSLDETFR